ncbi:3-dehydroquinate synthase [Haloimpatiens sp. FM7330]|uniref:3-dehydroquinate synthase n=1 Tax=Haloimpatiens sp. FM7330 TaxID=3298610 RepID=UPI00362D5931
MPTLEVKLSHKSYNIYIKKGILNDIGEKLKNIYSGEKIAVITDDNVYRIYGDKLKGILEKSGFLVSFIVIEHGEKSKSLSTLENVYNELLDFKITRSDLIITFGGGVVGDLGGFAASTFLRGTTFVQIPTSLLSQIDSSIGGKVAVDLPRGKNLVGSFYHPEAVFIDPNVLKTLEKRFFHDGMGEVIKYGCIKDKTLFHKLLNFKDEEELFNDIDNIIYSCCSIKKDIVQKDERDNNVRMLLNFGHTIAHAVEKIFNYETYTHGEAVAIGMYTITKRSEQLGITKEGTSALIKEILVKYNLPYSISNLNSEKVSEIVGLDKKNKGNILNLILIECIGKSLIKPIDKNKDLHKFI